MSEEEITAPEKPTGRAKQWVINRLLPLIAVGMGGLLLSVLLWGFQISADVSASIEKVDLLKTDTEAHNVNPGSHMNDMAAVVQNTTDIKVLAEGTQRQFIAIKESQTRQEAAINALGVEMRGNMATILERLPPLR